ncbi:MAG: hypothetical protein MUC97_17645, partial [Bernardetiaceae bacterium]|nr:hypothetical protein [Bernardetiaceae bacterium]
MKPRQLLPTLLCLFGLAGPGQAQTDSTQAAPSPVHIDKRIELEINARRGSNYRVMPLGPTGMLLFFENEEPLRSFKKEVIIGKYSPDLNLQWAQTFALETTSNLNIYAMQGDWLYFLVPKLEKNYEILRLNVRSGAFSLVKYPKILDMDVTQFAVLNEVFYLGGMVNGNPVVVHYNHQAGKPKVLPGINQLKATLNRLDVDAPSGRLSVMLTSNQRRKAAFYYLLYDNEGKAISNYTAPYEKEYTLFTFRPHYLNAQEQLIYGLYSLSAKDKAQGVYVAKLKNNEQESLKFYDFGYFKNFFNYLVPRRKERLLSRLRDRRDEGKIYKHDYNFFMRDLQFVGDKTILVAESYTPIFTEGTPGLRPYTTGLWGAAPWALTPSAFAFNNPALDPFGRPSNRTPVGYRFKHAFVCAFDASGKLLWDNGYEFKDLESTQPDQFV